MIRPSGSVAAWLLGFALCAAAAVAEPPWRLLMFDEEFCEYCWRWQEEVGGVYPRTREGRRVPLVRVALEDGVPEGVSLGAPVRYTPTFVLLDAAGRERGRITGYLGEHHFWALLAEIFEREGLD